MNRRDIARLAAFGKAIDTIEIGSWQNIDDLLFCQRRAAALLRICQAGPYANGPIARQLRQLIRRAKYLERAARKLAKKARALDPVF